MRSFITDFLDSSPSAPALVDECLTKFLIPKLLLYSCSSSSSSNQQQQQQRKLKSRQQQQQQNSSENNTNLSSLTSQCNNIIKQVISERAPLAMRTFRPRPLRQYEPLLMDDTEDELKERRTMKKELREGRKRIIRGVQASAAVERRETERARRTEDEHRAGKYKTLMAELQSQQQIMSTVDKFKAKAKSKKRKGISGMPTGDASGGGDDDAAGGGDD